MLVFVEGEETFGARREPTTNSIHIWHQAGVKPGPHWWEVSAVTSAPSLFEYVAKFYQQIFIHINWLRTKALRDAC